MAVTSAAVGAACTIDDGKMFGDVLELGVKIPRSRNIADGFSFDSLCAVASVRANKWHW
jgi:hypothetical protein